MSLPNTNGVYEHNRASAKEVKFIAGLMHELNVSEAGLCCEASRLARRPWPFARIEEFDRGMASWAIDQLTRKRRNPESAWNPKANPVYETRLAQRRAFEAGVMES